MTAMMMEAANTSETSVSYETTQRKVPEDGLFVIRSRENLKSRKHS
jgi:hypothetical protein